MKQIPLTQGKFAIVDDEDFEYLNQFKWYAHKQGNGIFYATRDTGGFTHKTKLYMHRIILDSPKGYVCDHIDGDTLNNQRANLRACTHAENMCNRGKQSNNTSGFKGVRFDKRRNRWYANIEFESKGKHLGYFDDPMLAARAYDLAAIQFHGSFANLNFPRADYE